MARKTKAEAEATRQTILTAAINVFWSEGVGRATLEEIACDAGVTRGAVYWHFKNKVDVFWALYEQMYMPFYEMVLNDLAQDHPAPLQQLEELCSTIFIKITEDESQQRLLAIFLLKTEYSGELEHILECQNERKAESADLFITYFKRAQQKDHLAKNADPLILTLSLLSYMTGLTYELLRNPKLFNVQRRFKVMFQYFFAGLK